MIPSKASDAHGRRNEGKYSGIRMAALLLFTLSSAHAALLTESSYLVSQSGSQSGITLPSFSGGSEGGLAPLADDNAVSRNALNVTAAGYILSFYYGSEDSSGAASTDNARGPVVAIITDMIRASHTFRSSALASEALMLQANSNLFTNAHLD